MHTCVYAARDLYPPYTHEHAPTHPRTHPHKCTCMHTHAYLDEPVSLVEVVRVHVRPRRPRLGPQRPTALGPAKVQLDLQWVEGQTGQC